MARMDAKIELSSAERNFIIFGFAIMEEVPKILQILLSIKIKASDLKQVIQRTPMLIRPRGDQLRLLASKEEDPDYKTFDISLLYLLLRNLCPDYKPTAGWGKMPRLEDNSIGDDIERLRVLRNDAFAHVASTKMTDATFLKQWGNLNQICERMEDNINRLGHDLQYTNELQKIYKKKVSREESPSFLSKLTKLHIFGRSSITQGEDTAISIFYDCDDQTLDNIGSLFWKRERNGVLHSIDLSNYKYEGSQRNKLVIRKTSKEDEGIYQVEVKMKNENISFQSNEIQLTITAGKIQPNWAKSFFLGQGGFGKVYVCEDGITAVKITKIEGNPAEKNKLISNMQNEIDVLKKLEHRRIVKYLACQHDCEEISIFMEYLQQGSLKREIDDNKLLQESTARDYTKQILEGLEFLHEQKITHRDIKASNILRGEDGLKLADFGVSKIMEDISSGKLLSQVGTPKWQSPEIIKNKGHGRRTDIWSLGCTIVEMLTGNPPWDEYNTFQAILKIGSGEEPEYILPEGITESCKKVLSLCFKQNPNDRPYAWDLLKNEWLTLS
ncbi:uncharacterized protein LOC134257546 [Saccostrea cucullata]|uniref:uncharacterized protein LOC134257546 n=1 Tax=Saccostrea cuccullata TaxID=36930 RepID=UPI002ED24E25